VPSFSRPVYWLALPSVSALSPLAAVSPKGL
jgi:hypothetical protein